MVAQLSKCISSFTLGIVLKKSGLILAVTILITGVWKAPGDGMADGDPATAARRNSGSVNTTKPSRGG